MNRGVPKALLRLLAFFSLALLLAVGLNAVNLAASHYMAADGNAVNAETLGNSLYRVENLSPPEHNAQRLVVKNVKDRAVAALLDGLDFPHEIYVNKERVSQNVSADAKHYDSAHAYKIIWISLLKCAGQDAEIEIRGSGAAGVRFYLADGGVMTVCTEIRTVCYSFLLLCLLLMTMAFIFCYAHNRRAYYFVFFAAVGFISILKSISLGELFAFSGALHPFLARGISFGGAGANIGMLAPVIAALYLMNIPINRKIGTALAVYLALAAAFALWDKSGALLSALAAGACLSSAGISVYGRRKKAPFHRAVAIVGVLCCAFFGYEQMVLSGRLKSGILHFYFRIPHLACVICLGIFTGAFLKRYFEQIKVLEEQRKKYEKIALLRGIGHDLKLPLSVIKINNQMLMKYEISDEEKKDCAKMSLEAAAELEKMADNINSLLNPGEAAGKEAFASIRQSFDKITRHYAARGESAESVFTAEFKGGDAMLATSPIRFERLLYNLLDNAFKYSPDNARVELTCAVLADTAEITVKDNGIGMDKSRIDRIFAPFYRGDDSRNKDGLGLGLSVVKEIADELGAKIAVQSRKGEGTEVKLVFPLA